MKILAIKLRAIGDTVIWTSALAALKKAKPEAEIHCVTYSSNEAILTNQPFVHRAYYLQSKSRWELYRLLWALRRERFDYLLGFHATTSLCRSAFLAGAGSVVLNHHDRGPLVDAIARDYLVFEKLGLVVPREPTSIALSGGERAGGEARVSAAIQAVGGDLGRPRFMFLPGAGHFLRRYPFDLWWPLVLRVRDQGAHQPVVVVDEALGREWNLPSICAEARVPLVMGGSLRDFLAAVGTGRRALANDSGPGHMAVALGLRVDFVFGPGCVGDWHCYDRAVHPLHRVAVDCRAAGPRDLEAFQFCTVEACAHHRCMRENIFSVQV